LVLKSSGARCKEKAIYDAFGLNELEPVGLSGFRDFVFNGENAEGLSVQVAASAESACPGLKSKFVDSQLLDFCLESRISDAKLRSGTTCLSRYESVTLGESCFDHVLFVRQQHAVKSHA
jgi:hypothetical protein